MSADKFENAVCAKLFEEICKYDDKGVKPSPAELINCFADDETAQKFISEMFMKDVKYSNDEEFEQALNDYIRTIEKEYITSAMSKASDLEKVSELLAMLKKTNTDGIKYINLV